MKVRRNKAIGMIILVVSILDACLFLSLIYAKIKPDFLFGLIGLLGIGLGILFLRGTYFEATPDSLIVWAWIGTARNTFQFGSKKEISIDGGSVYVADNGERRRLPIHAWMADKKDWEAFTRWLQTKR
jgi:hypothetical protein